MFEQADAEGVTYVVDDVSSVFLAVGRDEYLRAEATLLSGGKVRVTAVYR
jgi:hypothetical protein